MMTVKQQPALSWFFCICDLPPAHDLTLRTGPSDSMTAITAGKALLRGREYAVAQPAKLARSQPLKLARSGR